MATFISIHPRLLSCTKLLTSHVNQGSHEAALSLFHQMQSSLTIDPFVFSLVLKSCASINRPQLGTSVHSHSYKSGYLSNPFVACALVNMYGKCISIPSARKLFDESPNRNTIVWNAMISLYVHSNNVQDALQLFEVMDVVRSVSSFNSIIAGFSGLEDGSYKAIGFYRGMQEFGLKPDLITLLALLPASLGVGSLCLVKEIHGYSIRNGIDPQPQLQSGLVEAYGRSGCLFTASTVFQCMKERDVVAWSSLISAYALHGEATTALEIFRQMELAKVQPDDITFIGVFKACSHAGLADEALDYFARMQKDYGVQASSDHYSCLVDVLSRAGRLNEAYEVTRQMPMKATAKAWGAILGGCRTYGEVELAEIAARALCDIEPDNPANFVLLSKIYANVGRHEEAQKMRWEMQERGAKAAPGSSWVMYQE